MLLQVPITKAGPGQYQEVDTDAVPEPQFVHILQEGAKVIINGGGSKLTPYSKATTDEERETFRTAAVELAAKRYAQMLANELSTGRGRSAKTDGIPAAVVTEARRIARDLVKDTIKHNGGRVSHYKPSDITAAANDLLADEEQGPGFIAMARENLAARKKSTITITLPSLKEDPKLVAKAEEKKILAKAATLSKVQAGKVAPRVGVPVTKH